jgi:hypothetical protein
MLLRYLGMLFAAVGSMLGGQSLQESSPVASGTDSSTPRLPAFVSGQDAGVMPARLANSEAIPGLELAACMQFAATADAVEPLEIATRRLLDKEFVAKLNGLTYKLSKMDPAAAHVVVSAKEGRTLILCGRTPKSAGSVAEAAQPIQRT